MKTMRDVARRLESATRWVSVLQDGINGRIHSLGIGEGEAMEKALSRLGVRLLSKTRAAREGLVVRRGARPVVRRSYGQPIGLADLYCIQQFNLKPASPKKESKS